MINDEANNLFCCKKMVRIKFFRLVTRQKRSNNGDNNFQNALNDALNYQTIEKHLQRISKLKPYIDKYIWEGIDFLVGPKDWKKFEKNNKTIALNVLYIPRNKNNKCCIQIRT